MNPASLLLETLRLDEGTDPASLYSAWLHVETNGLARLVEFEGCALWLRQRLAQLNARDFADRRFRTWLDHRSRELVSRNLLVDAQIDRAARALSDGNVPFVLIRGSAWRALADTIPRADARAASGVEVLIPAARARDAWNEMRAAGYELAPGPAERPPVTPSGRFHLPSVWNLSRVAVELHTSTSDAVPAAEAWRRANVDVRRMERGGVAVPVQSSSTELLWHSLTDALHHDASAFRLHFLLEAAAIVASPMPVNWAEVGSRLDSSEIADRRAAVQWLGVAAALAGESLPENVMEGVNVLDIDLVLRWRLALLRRMGVPSPLAVRVLDGLPHPAMAAARLTQGSAPAWFARALSHVHR
jgi:Uncharacterised nucleotidyltransferase